MSPLITDIARKSYRFPTTWLQTDRRQACWR